MNIKIRNGIQVEAAGGLLVEQGVAAIRFGTFGS